MPFDSNAFLNNPWTQMGLGILGANQPGVGTAAAIGGGASAGLNNLMRLQLMKEDATLRKTKAEMLKEESARAKAQAQQDAEIRRVQDERLAREYPELVGASEEEKKQFFKNQYQTPMGFTRGPDGKLVADENWLLAQERLKRAGRQTTTTNISPNIFTGDLNKGVVGGAQSGYISAGSTLPEIEIARGMVKAGKGLANPFARAFGTLASLVSGAGEFMGSETLASLGENIRPTATMEDGKEIIPSQIKGQLLAVKTAAREVMAPDKGPLTTQEQSDYKEALGMLDSSDYRDNLAGLDLLQGVMQRRMGRLGMVLETAGERIPGKLYPGFVDPDTNYTYKGGDPNQKSSWEAPK